MLSASRKINRARCTSTPGRIYFNHDPDYIMRMADEAAALGVERFIIDDGWFKGRNDDHAALGDWYLDKKKYPNGLKPVIDHVKQLSMEFGIWVEPEMINPDSDLYRAHPDWVLALPGYAGRPGDTSWCSISIFRRPLNIWSNA